MGWLRERRWDSEWKLEIFEMSHNKAHLLHFSLYKFYKNNSATEQYTVKMHLMSKFSQFRSGDFSWTDKHNDDMFLAKITADPHQNIKDFVLKIGVNR